MTGSADRDSAMKTVHLRIRGRVQGVWFRAWTVRTASGMGVSGWVRNRSDGTVEAVLSGSAEQVDALVQACHRGPPTARVDAVDISPWTADRPVGPFVQKDTE